MTDVFPNAFWFGGKREEVIQRDGEKCVQCGMTRAAHRAKWNRDITVDHIDGNGRNRPAKLKNNDLSNLQTLCIPCHSKKDNKNKLKTHCPQGHEYTPENTYYYPTRSNRSCRACGKARTARDTAERRRQGKSMARYHCPIDYQFLTNVHAEEYGELQDSNGWNPYYQWHAVGTCAKHGLVEFQDHDAEDKCGCWSAGVWDVWMADSNHVKELIDGQG